MGERYRETACTSLQQVLIEAAEKHGELTIGFVESNGEIQDIRYDQLFRNAKKILTALRERGLREGDYLILASDSNKRTISFFWAAVLGGIIPTILQPPVSFNSHNPAAEKLYSVYDLLNQPCLILPSSLKDTHFEHIDKGQIIYDNICFENLSEGVTTASKPEDTAYIQFSSGSTGNPKGVMLSHENLLTNADSIAEGLKLSSLDCTANWMPLYHDMGLIGYHITPIYYSHYQIHIETIDFIKNPFLWLQAMSERKVNISGCPNFGLALVNRHMLRKDPGNIDLSNLRGLLNGAEPISPEIMEQFIENFRKYGFRENAMMPVYGMAEATLAITFNPIGTKPIVTTFKRYCLVKNNAARIYNGSMEETQRIVSVGKPLSGVEISIQSRKGDILRDGMVGEICVKGKSVFQGYFRDKDKPESKNKNEWFRTGDQGFILMDDLYITGRYKDIIFINGSNYYANDLEATAIRECDLVYGKFIIGGYHDEKKGHDSIIAFMVGSDNQATRSKCKEVGSYFLNKLGIPISNFVLVRSNQIPKTSSGKIKRYKIIQAFQGGELKEISI